MYFHIVMEVHLYFKICLCSNNRLGDVPPCSSKYICVVRIGFEVTKIYLCSKNRVGGRHKVQLLFIQANNNIR